MLLTIITLALASASLFHLYFLPLPIQAAGGEITAVRYLLELMSHRIIRM